MNDFVIGDLDTVRSLHQASAIGPHGLAHRPLPRRAPAVRVPIVGLRRRSCRAFAPELPSLAWLQTALRTTYGEHRGHRAVPSAGAIYGLTFHAIGIAGPEPGRVHRFDHAGRLTAVPVPPAEDAIRRAVLTELRGAHWIVVASADLARYAERYAVRGYRYALLEAGHWAQALLGHAVGAGLETVALGAFEDAAIADAVGLGAAGLEPLYAIAVGRAADAAAPSLPSRLRTERLVLRPLSLADADDVRRYADDPQWARFLPVPQPYTRADALEFVERFAGVPGVWACEHDGRVIGTIDIHPTGHRAWIGYSIARDMWGHGFATEAAVAIVDAAFEARPELHKIFATVHPDNVASARVLRRIGMHEDARLPRHGRLGGEVHDELVFSILRDEHRARRSAP